LDENSRFYGPQISGPQNSKSATKPLFRRSHDLSGQGLPGLITEANERLSGKHAFNIGGQWDDLNPVQVGISSIVGDDHGRAHLLDLAPIDGSKSIHQTSPRFIVCPQRVADQAV
jgi:hypothetical protein